MFRFISDGLKRYKELMWGISQLNKTIIIIHLFLHVIVPLNFHCIFAPPRFACNIRDAYFAHTFFTLSCQIMCDFLNTIHFTSGRRNLLPTDKHKKKQQNATNIIYKLHCLSQCDDDGWWSPTRIVCCVGVNDGDPWTHGV